MVIERRRREATEKEPLPTSISSLMPTIAAGFKPGATVEDNTAEEAKREIAARWRQWMYVAGKMGKRYSNCTLSSFMTYGTPEQQAAQQAAVISCKEFAASIEQNIRDCYSVVMFGPPGTGKDHMMAALLREACRAGFKVEWINGLDFFGNMRDRIDAETPEEALIRELAHPDVLAISDPLPPWGPLTSFQAQTMFRVMDRRYRSMKPIWTTINVASGAEASDRIGTAVIDRLRERALSIHCNWPSYRTFKA